MTDKEEDAIEELKKEIEFDKKILKSNNNYLKEQYESEMKAKEIILNLTDRLKGENEEKTTILLAGAEKVKQLEKENTELKAMLEHRIKYTQELEEDLFENSSKYVISKDKIRDKIKEWDKSIKWANADDHYYAIKILKELLEDK